MYDITKADSLSSLDHFLELISMESEQRVDAGGVMPVKIIAGNKCDLARVRQVRSAQGLDYARRHGCGFMETSARDMVNIEETFARESQVPRFPPATPDFLSFFYLFIYQLWL